MKITQTIYLGLLVVSYVHTQPQPQQGGRVDDEDTQLLPGDPSWLARILGTTITGDPNVGLDGPLLRQGGAGIGEVVADGLRRGWDGNPSGSGTVPWVMPDVLTGIDLIGARAMAARGRGPLAGRIDVPPRGPPVQPPRPRPIPRQPRIDPPPMRPPPRQQPWVDPQPVRPPPRQEPWVDPQPVRPPPRQEPWVPPQPVRPPPRQEPWVPQQPARQEPWVDPQPVRPPPRQEPWVDPQGTGPSERPAPRVEPSPESILQEPLAPGQLSAVMDPQGISTSLADALLAGTIRDRFFRPPPRPIHETHETHVIGSRLDEPVVIGRHSQHPFNATGSSGNILRWLQQTSVSDPAWTQDFGHPGLTDIGSVSGSGLSHLPAGSLFHPQKVVHHGKPKISHDNKGSRHGSYSSRVPMKRLNPISTYPGKVVPRKKLDPVSSYPGKLIPRKKLDPVSSYPGKLVPRKKKDPVSSYPSKLAHRKKLDPVSTYPSKLAHRKKLEPVSSYPGKLVPRKKLDPVSSYPGRLVPRKKLVPVSRYPSKSIHKPVAEHPAPYQRRSRIRHPRINPQLGY